MKSKLKTSHALGFWLVDYIYDDDNEEPQHMDKDFPTQKPPLQQILVPLHPSVNMPSSSTFVPLSSPLIPPLPSHIPPPSLHGFISGLHQRFDQMSFEFYHVSQEISYVWRHFSSVEYWLEIIDFSYEYVWNLEEQEIFHDCCRMLRQDQEQCKKVSS